jgi:hypothetical protein
MLYCQIQITENSTHWCYRAPYDSRMSWLLFIDESGHDHKNCPYEVRGGVAIHASRLWPLDKGADQQFVRQMERYFTKTQTGRCRTAWIVPVPMFVASDMTMAIQAADLAACCTNWGFRVPQLGLNEPTRAEIADEFGPWLKQPQFRGHMRRNERDYDCYGITYVPNPYGQGRR